MMRSVESKCCISKKSRGPGIEATLPGSQMFSVQKSTKKTKPVQISAAVQHESKLSSKLFILGDDLFEMIGMNLRSHKPGQPVVFVIGIIATHGLGERIQAPCNDVLAGNLCALGILSSILQRSQALPRFLAGAVHCYISIQMDLKKLKCIN